MINSTLLHRLLTANIIYEKYSRNYRRLILLNILLYITATMASFFALFNVFYLGEFLIGFIDIMVVSAVFYAIYDIHTSKHIQRAIYIFITILFIFLISFSLINQNQSYGLIWTIFFPLVSILLLEKGKGLSFSVLFYFIVFFFAFEGIGSWQNTHWDVASFLRFVAASVTLTYIVYFMEYSHELSEDILEQTRKEELESIRALEELSIKDTLTNLYNRRYLNEVFLNSFQTAQRHHNYFAFYILDIDYFKQYNDTYGHQKGDEVLCALAEVLQSHMRRSEDYVFRLGGEEFCGICVSDDASKIEAQLKVLQHAIESLNIEHEGSSVAKVLTITMGVKIIDDFNEQNFDSLYKAADEALYKAKNGGRNSIIFS